MAIIYVDSLAGNDANPGTFAAPKATPRGAFLIHNAFDEISFKAGRCYAPFNGFFPRFTKNGVKVTAYGLTSGADKWTDYPIWDGLTYENSGSTGWVHEGGGVWSKSFGTAKAKRIWFGSHNGGVLTSQRTIGTAYRRTPGSVVDDITAIKAALNSTDRWHSSGSALGWKLYVYTGSTTVNPATFYNGLAILICDGSTVGGEEGLYATQVSGCRANNIHIRGAHGDSGVVCTLTTDTLPTDDIVYENCISSCNGLANVWAIRTKATDGNPRKKITNSYLKNIEADSKSSTYEQDPDTNYNNFSGMDMFVITGNCENCHIWDFKATNSAHVGAAMGGATGAEPVNCSILRGYIKFDSWVTYGRGIATAKMTSSTIGQCIIDGQNVRSQFADGWIVGNKWINMRASIRKDFTDEWAAIECYVYDYGNAALGSYRYETRKPSDLLIANNYVDQPVATPGANPFLITTYSSTYPVTEPNPSIDLNTVRIHNNIVILPVARTWLGCFVNGGAIADQLIKNNIIYTSGGADATVRWQSGTLVGMNVKPGHTGNLNVNPLLDVNHKPQTGSPAISAGVPIGSGFKDQAGVTFSSTTPSIGAYEFVPPPPAEEPPPPPPPIPVSGIINDRDVMMQAASMRYESVNTRSILLAVNTPVFKVNNAGTATPGSIDITAKLFGVAGTVTFSTTPAVTLSTNGNTATLTYAAMGANTSVKVTASLEYGGVTLTQSIDIAKVLDGTNGTSGTDGTNGTNGQRGTVQIVASGSSWSDATANSAITSATGTSPINRDQVTITNSTSFSQTRFYDNGSWLTLAAWVNGNMVVDGTLSAAKITTGTMSADRINGGTISGTNIDISGQFVVTISGGTANTSIAAPFIERPICDNSTASGLPGVTSSTSGSGPGIKSTSSSSGPAYEAVGGSSGNALVITSGLNGIVQNGGGANYLRTLNPSVDNTYSIGTSGSLRWTALYAMSSTITTSDERTKTDIQPTNLGLSFILDQQPVSYLQIVAENEVVDNFVEVVPERRITDDFGDLIIFPAKIENRPIITPRPGKRRHYGLRAQHVRAMLLKHNAPNAAIWSIADVTNPDSAQALRYEEFVPVLMKSDQELYAEISALKDEVAELSAMVKTLLESK